MNELDPVFKAVASYFSVMAEPMRLKIVHALCYDEKSVKQIVEQLGATQTNISRHLALMYRSGVVTKRKDGNQVFYRISDPAMLEVCRAVCIQIAGQIDESKPVRKGLLTLIPGRRRAA